MSRPSNKKRLNDKLENVSPPWEAWEHVEKGRKFYVNVVTGKSIWEHPSTLNEAVKGAPKQGRKRREPEKKDLDEANLMEVDLPPPPKRKTTENSEPDERVIKKARKSLRQEEHQEYENLQPASKYVDPDKILPRVSWSSKIRPLKRLPYRGCAIFDTCALIEYPPALDVSVEKQILTVIPYAVHSELDGLKGNPKTSKIAREVTERLKDLLQQKNSYLLVETSTEQRIQIERYRPDEAVKDDIILNCALRVKEEVMSIAPLLNLNERAVLLVTNDTVLSNKAMTHGIEIGDVATFIDTINMNERPPETKTGKKKSSASTNSQATLPPVSAEPSKNKKICIDQIQQTRELDVRNQEGTKSYKSSNSASVLTGPPLVPNASSKDKKMAIEKIHKNREVNSWIGGMVKNVRGRASEASREDTNSLNSTPVRPRPSIPLEDEVIPTLTKTVKPKSVYTPQLAYQSQNTVKSTQSTRLRPMMPCSISDDEDDCPIVAGDEMDCS